MKRLTVWSLVLLASAVVAVSAAPAYAVDGVVLINQNTSVNGLPGCGSSGFPIVICNSGSYKLSGNLVVPGSSGIVINVSNVTIDLDGFTISGSVTCTGSGSSLSCIDPGFTRGIYAVADNITLRNGSVVGLTRGVQLNGNSNVVEGLLASGNSEYGLIVDNGVVRRNVASRNGVAGLNTFMCTVTENVADLHRFLGLVADVAGIGSNV